MKPTPKSVKRGKVICKWIKRVCYYLHYLLQIALSWLMETQTHALTLTITITLTLQFAPTYIQSHISKYTQLQTSTLK